jgi:tetraprenyl-beta-curcumene synthase
VYQPTPRAPLTRPCRTPFTDNAPDPSPLSARQLWALTTAATRELTWGLPAVAHEVHRWHTLASDIPDERLREDALNALTEQRTHIDGAALFSTLPRARNSSLLHLLVAYEVIWDYLDNVNERDAAAGLTNGLQLHLALVDALDPTRPISDYYKYSPWHDDGGYLCALVASCRANCVRLPSYEQVRRAVVREADRGRVCAINHVLDPLSRDGALEAWATSEFPLGHEAQWFELTAAASTNLTIFALLALASEPVCSEALISQTSLAYFPWISILTAMLDSYVDQSEDAVSGNHGYVTHYPTQELATRRIRRLIRRCLREAESLDDGEKHMLIASCMFAMYLSKSSALTPAMRETTRRLVVSGGSLTRVLRPILRLWRTAYGLRSA